MGRGGGILSGDHHTGDAIRGRSIRAGRCRTWDTHLSKPVGLLGRPVDFRLGLRTRIGVYHSLPKNPRPNVQSTKESVA